MTRCQGGDCWAAGPKIRTGKLRRQPLTGRGTPATSLPRRGIGVLFPPPSSALAGLDCRRISSGLSVPKTQSPSVISAFLATQWLPDLASVQLTPLPSVFSLLLAIDIAGRRHLARAWVEGSPLIPKSAVLLPFCTCMRTSSAGRQRQLAREALAQLAEEDNLDPDAKEEAHSEEEAKMEESIRLWQQRMGAVVVVLRSTGAKRVLDLGCGERKAFTPSITREGADGNRWHGCFVSEP